MTSRWASRKWRWAVPGVAAAAVALGAFVTTTTAGASAPTLPHKTPAELIAWVQQAEPHPLSGTVVETARLGLPDLPSIDVGGSGLSLEGLLTGSHTMRVWYDGASRQRIALLAQMAEKDFVHNGRQLWAYQSTTNEVSHAVLPLHSEVPRTKLPLGVVPTPQQLAQRILTGLSPSTSVTVGPTLDVAGRAAYQLELAPRDARSLIDRVSIAIDAQTALPLQVQIYSRSASAAALQIGFTDISYTRPSASIFSFTTPPGAKTVPLDTLIGGPSSRGDSSEFGTPSLLGKGWTAVLKLSPKSGQRGQGGQGGLGIPMLGALTKPVPGGRLLSTALVSVLIKDDGTIYVGSVTGAALQHVAASGHGL